MRGLVLLCSIVAATGCRPAASPSGPGSGPGGSAGVLTFSVVTAGRHTGDAEIRIEPDGKRVSHFAFNDRGRGPDVRSEVKYDDAGAPRWLRATGNDYLKAPVDERLDTSDGKLTWQSTSERGQAPAHAGFYLALADGVGGNAALARALLRAKDHRLKLLPSGEAWLEDDATREIDVVGTRRRLRRVAIAGLGFGPTVLWLDEGNEMFAQVSSWISVVRSGAEAAIPALVAEDQAWSAARSARLAGKLAHRPPGGKLAITHARLYDSEAGTVMPDSTVIVEGDRITAVGNAATAVPAGAQVIDAHGRTLLPGLWDMHVHLGPDDGALLLASGVTTARDMGNDRKELSARVGRFDAGGEIGPHVLRAGLIDGPGEFAAPIGQFATTAVDAVGSVTLYADAGYDQIKIYSSLSPTFVPIIASTAHARGLRVSGHIPKGMNAAQAVESGYDEIQHANFLFLRFLAGPQDDTRTPLRFTRVAERAADLDLQSSDVQQFLDLLVSHHTVLDPTLATFHGMFTADPGELDPVLVPYAGRLPVQILRGGKSGGLPAPGGKRAKYRASFEAMLRMIKLAWDRKIPIVAGTDNVAGLTLPHELELYVKAGIPATDVLSLATLGAARVMGKDRETGSIAVGKRADLVLIDGDPTRDIATVRNVDTVVCRGVVYDPAELFSSVGVRGRSR